MTYTVKHTIQYAGGHDRDPGYRATVVTDGKREYLFHTLPDGSDMRDVQTRIVGAQSFRRLSAANAAKRVPEMEGVIKEHLARIEALKTGSAADTTGAILKSAGEHPEVEGEARQDEASLSRGALAGVGDAADLEIPETVVCEHCGATHNTDDLESETWLQWQCPSCHADNDKPVAGDYMDPAHDAEVAVDPIEELKREAREEMADPARDAAQVAMLKALKELRSAAVMFRDAAYRAEPHLRVSNEATNMLSAFLLSAQRAISQAEDAGIK